MGLYIPLQWDRGHGIFSMLKIIQKLLPSYRDIIDHNTVEPPKAEHIDHWRIYSSPLKKGVS